MDAMKLIGIILATTGFWKLIEVLITYKSKKRLERAQEKNIVAEATTKITKNWIMWSTKMEKRVAQLENKNTKLSGVINKQSSKTNELEKEIGELKSKNTELRSIIGKQRTRITDLEKHVDQLEKVNRDLNNKDE